MHKPLVFIWITLLWIIVGCSTQFPTQIPKSQGQVWLEKSKKTMRRFHGFQMEMKHIVNMEGEQKTFQAYRIWMKEDPLIVLMDADYQDQQHRIISSYPSYMINDQWYYRTSDQHQWNTITPSSTNRSVIPVESPIQFIDKLQRIIEHSDDQFVDIVKNDELFYISLQHLQMNPNHSLYPVLLQTYIHPYIDTKDDWHILKVDTRVHVDHRTFTINQIYWKIVFAPHEASSERYTIETQTYIDGEFSHDIQLPESLRIQLQKQ